MVAALGQGHDAYILCGSLRKTPELAKAFTADSGFRINDPTAFALAVGQVLPGFRGGLEGSCSYQERRIVRRSVRGIDLETLRSEDGKNVDMDKAMRAIGTIAGDDLYFLKLEKHQHQAEYRLIWTLHDQPQDFILVKCPQAREFCTRFEDINPGW
jgi:hypothetical protein